MQKTQEQVIDGIRYSTSQFSAGLGLRLSHRLSKFILPSLAQGIGSIKGTGKLLDREFDGEGLKGAVQAFYFSCDEYTLETTTKELLGSTLRDGKPINFEIDFAGRIGHLLKVLVFIVEVNFADFTAAIVELFGRLKLQAGTLAK